MSILIITKTLAGRSLSYLFDRIQLGSVEHLFNLRWSVHERRLVPRSVEALEFSGPVGVMQWDRGFLHVFMRQYICLISWVSKIVHQNR